MTIKDKISIANPGKSNRYTNIIVHIFIGIIILKLIPILLNQYNKKKLNINFWTNFLIINTPSKIYDY